MGRVIDDAVFFLAVLVGGAGGDAIAGVISLPNFDWSQFAGHAFGALLFLAGRWVIRAAVGKKSNETKTPDNGAA